MHDAPASAILAPYAPSLAALWTGALRADMVGACDLADPEAIRNSLTIEGNLTGLLGYTARDLLGQPVTFLSETAQGERDLAQLQQALSGAPCTGYETILRTGYGEEIRLHIRAEVLRDTAGRVAGIRGTARPVAIPVP